MPNGRQLSPAESRDHDEAVAERRKGHDATQQRKGRLDGYKGQGTDEDERNDHDRVARDGNHGRVGDPVANLKNRL